MTPEQLRVRAVEEVAELGPEPTDPHDRELWVEERRGACVLLASLADWRASVCRKAALELGELTEPDLVRLVLDAAERECR